VLTGSSDHPDVEELHERAAAIDPGISLATVYRTLRLFEEINLLERHDFRGGRARYEQIPDEHHDHLIDLENGHVIEFQNSEIEAMQRAVAERLGYKLIDHRLELYAVPLNSKKVRKDPKSGG
jgi:Fur family transcriptional regulator, ferric uptake regulator